MIHSLFSDGDASNPHLTRRLESVSAIRGGLENELESLIHTTKREDVKDVRQEKEKVQEISSQDANMEVQKVPLKCIVFR